jgi:hypothetical protein
MSIAAGPKKTVWKRLLHHSLPCFSRPGIRLAAIPRGEKIRRITNLISRKINKMAKVNRVIINIKLNMTPVISWKKLAEEPPTGSKISERPEFLKKPRVTSA